MSDPNELLRAQLVALRFGLPIPRKLDKRPDGSGIDDGPYLNGCAPRKPQPIKSDADHAEIKARAWATRRAKYGKAGHR